MGYDLMKAALLTPGFDISPAARLVLIRMGLRALDTPNGKGQPPNLYYDGWEPLALQLGQGIPRDDDRSEGAERIRRKAYEAVRVRLKELAEAGAITRLNVAGKGRRQTYRLNLGIGAPRIDSTPTLPQGFSGPSPQRIPRARSG